MFATTGEYVTGIVSASGNIVSAANITGGNLLTAGLVSVTGTLSVSGATTLANLSAGKYGEVGMKFYMDLEDAFGGPMTQQFRDMLLRNVGGMAAKLEKMLQ